MRHGIFLCHLGIDFLFSRGVTVLSLLPDGSRYVDEPETGAPLLPVMDFEEDFLSKADLRVGRISHISADVVVPEGGALILPVAVAPSCAFGCADGYAPQLSMFFPPSWEAEVKAASSFLRPTSDLGPFTCAPVPQRPCRQLLCLGSSLKSQKGGVNLPCVDVGGFRKMGVPFLAGSVFRGFFSIWSIKGYPYFGKCP